MVRRIPVTASDHAAIVSKAEQVGMTKSGFVRACALGERIPAMVESAALDADEKAQLHVLGTKINDIAKAMNSGRNGLPHPLEATCDELDALLDLLTERTT